MKKYIVIFWVSMLVACAGTPTLEQSIHNKQVDVTNVQIKDQRDPSLKVAYRSSMFSPMATLGDRAVNPPPLATLRKFFAFYGVKGKNYDIEVIDLRIFDYFAASIKAAQASQTGALQGIANSVVNGVGAEKTDWSLIEKLKVPMTTDSIICSLKVKINGIEITEAAYQPYKPPFMAPVPKLTDAYKNAIELSIGDAANIAMKSYENKK